MFEALASGCIDGISPGGLVLRHLFAALTSWAVGDGHDKPHTELMTCSHADIIESRRMTLDCRIISDSTSSS